MKNRTKITQKRARKKMIETLKFELDSLVDRYGVIYETRANEMNDKRKRIAGPFFLS